MHITIIGYLERVSQRLLMDTFGYSELPWNFRVIMYKHQDIPEEPLYGLEIDREMDIEAQNMTGVCDDYQDWYFNECDKYYFY